MTRPQGQVHKIAEITLSWLILAILLAFSYAKFTVHQYGFTWDSKGNIDRVFVNQPGLTLTVGDQLVQIGSLTWNDFQADLRKTLFAGVKPGETVPIVIERNSQRLNISWVLPGPNRGEMLDQLFSEWPMAYAFWLAGMFTLLFLRPKDGRWWLLSAFNFLTAIWISAGSGLSNFHIWYAALILRMTIWLCIPIYLHLHWVFPRPLGKLPPFLVGIGYAIAFGLMIVQWFQLFSQSLYFLGFLIAISGSFVLLLVHALRQPDTRRDLRLLLVATFSIFAFLFVVAVIAMMYSTFRVASLALLSFPVLPSVYLYAAYRRQLGGMEMRVNRLISIYLFVILLGVLELPLIVIAENLFISPDKTLMIATLSSLLTAAACLWGYPAFQTFVERHILGIRIPSGHIHETYSARITISASLSNLVRILADEVLPSLLVRQFVFFKFEKDSLKVIFSMGVRVDQIPTGNDLRDLMRLKDHKLFASNADVPISWMRLALPLKVGDEMLGIWLFGRRDPDDIYSQVEIPILQSLANQTAIALSNIIQTEHLKAIYETDINRYEQERLRLARDLHDNVLNQMAAMLMKDTIPPSPNFQKAYDGVIQRLREIVSDLRPPMLNYGLKPAIEGYADHLMNRSAEKVSVIVDLKSDGDRYSTEVEKHVFRIVQETCTNALRHANPTQITISGRLEPDSIELNVQDNGSGFDSKKPDLNTLQANNHFGMTGMSERAELIGADIKIESNPTLGTRVQINWKPGKR